MEKLSYFLENFLSKNLPINNTETWEKCELLNWCPKEAKNEVIDAFISIATDIIENFNNDNSYRDILDVIAFPLAFKIILSKYIPDDNKEIWPIYKEFKFDKEKVQEFLKQLNDCFSVDSFKKWFDYKYVDVEAEFVVFFQHLYTQQENGKFKEINKNK